MKREILITGGAGNLGSSLTNSLLLQNNNRVVVVDNLLTGNTDKLDKRDNLQFYNADVNSYQAMSEIMKSHSFDLVFHYAAVVGVERTLKNPIEVLKDIDGIKNILDLSLDADVKRVVFSSSSEVYGEPVEIPLNEQTTPLNSRLPYAIVKNVGEAYFRSYKKALIEVTPSGMREVFIENPDVKWADVGGLNDTKQELQEAVEWPMKYPALYDKLGHKMPHGILLHGPSGTGKTMLAKAVATESEANFVSVRGPELLSKWVGESERGIREIFRRARQSSPCVIFFDEIDSIAPIRGMGAETQVTERVVSQLLTELDGMQDMHGVIVLAATNRADMIDPALLRPGRFDKIIQIPMPDKESRKKILEINAEEIPFEKDPNSPDYVNFGKLAEATDGFSGADVAAIANTAVSFVIHEHLDKYSMAGIHAKKDSTTEEEKEAITKQDKEIAKVEKSADNAKVTMRHFEDAIKKVREQKDLKIGQKVELSAFR
mgnify:CR=1 FL=1